MTMQIMCYHPKWWVTKVLVHDPHLKYILCCYARAHNTYTYIELKQYHKNNTYSYYTQYS